MAETRRKFDQDFKEGAVRQVQETGKPIAQVARVWVPVIRHPHGFHGHGELLPRRTGWLQNSCLRLSH